MFERIKDRQIEKIEENKKKKTTKNEKINKYTSTLLSVH